MIALMTARELADMLGVSTETVLRWVRRGKLPAFRLPGGAIRFREDVIERLLDQWATPSRGVVTHPGERRPPVSYFASRTPEVEE
jgi:excisionase family DNA binding protein